MKLWFEGWIVNVDDASPLQRTTTPAATAALQRAINHLAVERRRGDSAGHNFKPKM